MRLKSVSVPPALLSPPTKNSEAGVRAHARDFSVVRAASQRGRRRTISHAKSARPATPPTLPPVIASGVTQTALETTTGVTTGVGLIDADGEKVAVVLAEDDELGVADELTDALGAADKLPEALEL